MPGLDWASKGGPRRLRRTTEQLENAFAAPSLSGKALDRAVRDYGRGMLLALEHDPALAARLFRDYDARIPADRYASAFGAGVEGTLGELAAREDRDVLTVVFGLATRLRVPSLQHRSRDLLADLLGRAGDADPLVAQLLRWQELGVLETDTMTRSLRGHLTRVPLSRDAQLWSSFFGRLPEPLVPELFEVRCFLGQGVAAIRLADTPVRRQEALDCCLRSPRIEDVRAGIELARGEGAAETGRRLEERAGELLLDAGDPAGALPRFQAAGRTDLVSECQERLGRFAEALASCPRELPDRLARLAGLCRPEVDALVERGEYAEAARRAQELAHRLNDAAEVTDALADRREELAGLRRAVLAEGRRHFDRQVRRADPADRAAVHQAWSRFEEGAGEPGPAAEQCEKCDDHYRAHRLYREAGRFGDAERVLKGEDTPEGRSARAEAREAGGDLRGAAVLHEEAGQVERAVALYLRAEDFAAAARCLVHSLGDEAIEDPRLARCLRRSGQTEELVRRCVQAVERRGRDTLALDELRRLRGERAVPPVLESEVRDLLETLDEEGRGPFEEGAEAWVRAARADIDGRFAGIWGMDLGTTTCAVAVYDSRAGRPVLCSWKGRTHFPATLSLNREDEEVVGLAGEEILGGRVRAHLSATKRLMGSRTVIRAGRDRDYRPEEVSARLISHARGMVEGMLAERVRERVGELARADLGEIRDEWLSWLQERYELRLDRPRAILTIPAFFLNNQKHATRHACEIAGVELVRLIHEPTAACITAARERRLAGRIAVVDLGAGTLDVSALEVDDGVYDVRQVLGDNRYGGKDLDAAVSAALAARLEREGVQVPAKGEARRRLEIAAEYLKISLSGQPHAEYSLPHFAGDADVRLELGREELAGILRESLRTLRRTCEEFRDSLAERPEHLVLVGGPMLSPLVGGLVEEVFGLRRTVLSDPRTAVACGAAVQAGVLDGRLHDQVLSDVTPFALGIRVAGDDDFSVVIDRNTHIPIVHRQHYTTVRDDQTAVDIEIFNGAVDEKSKIGSFRLGDIEKAPKGEPDIEVTFSIDASCVLEVTAVDKGTGNAKSIRLTDTTLLSPAELTEMAERHRRHRELDARRTELEALRGELGELVDEAGRSDSEPLWREFRDRLAGYRPSPAGQDAGTQRVLAEIFNEATDLEAELLSMRVPLLDLATVAREYLSRPARVGDLAECRYLVGALGERLDLLRPGLARVTLWNTLLARLAATESDPLLRFRDLHDAGDHARALFALGEPTGPLADLADVRRRLRCLAETGDADGYRRALVADAERLRAIVLEPDRPEAFLAHARPALVRVAVTPAAGEPGAGRGFLISDRLVVTNRHWLADRDGLVDTGRIEVVSTAGRSGVRHIFAPESAHLDVAVLQLDEPLEVTPLRLGHPRLVRIGDPVWAPGPGTPQDLVRGVIDRFESFPEQRLELYKTGLEVAPASSGNPLFNDLGEVVGVFTVGASRAAQGAYAVTVDALAPLLAGAGFGVTGDDAR